MLRWFSAAAAVVAVLTTAGCNLNVENPNNPDAPRAFQDPAGLAQLLGGAIRSWVEARDNYYVMPLNTQANNYTASWNNAAIRFYSSVAADCPIRCGWTNSATAPEASGGPTVEALWYGYYTVNSSASDVLKAIGTGVCFDVNCASDSTLTVRNKAIAKMLQGMALAGIALVYDQGFYVDENTDLSTVASLPFSPRAELRDSALSKFEQAYTIAGELTWSTPPEWTGVGKGTSYTNVQIQELIRTMEAELIALFPRNSAENATVDWARVALDASQGISSTTPFSFQFYIDASSRECGIDCIKNWGNSILTERVDTRVAAMVTSNHVDPWPGGSGNPCPTISADKRVGDGSYGPQDTSVTNAYGTVPTDSGAGTDFACSGLAPFPAARGQYHQSNLQHIRYHELASRGEDLPTDDGTGQDPFYTPQMNDLLWAEGLIRSGGDKTVAAAKINNSRVNRGGLAALTGAESDSTLIAALQYEQEIEFMGQGVDPFFNRRRSGENKAAQTGWPNTGTPQYVDGLVVGTPRHMPVPAKELNILLRAVYTFGGPSGPDMAGTVTTPDGVRRETVAQRFRELEDARPNGVQRWLMTHSSRLF